MAGLRQWLRSAVPALALLGTGVAAAGAPPYSEPLEHSDWEVSEEDATCRIEQTVRHGGALRLRTRPGLVIGAFWQAPAPMFGSTAPRLRSAAPQWLQPTDLEPLDLELEPWHGRVFRVPQAFVEPLQTRLVAGHDLRIDFPDGAGSVRFRGGAIRPACAGVSGLRRGSGCARGGGWQGPGSLEHPVCHGESSSRSRGARHIGTGPGDPASGTRSTGTGGRLDRCRGPGGGQRATQSRARACGRQCTDRWRRARLGCRVAGTGSGPWRRGGASSLAANRYLVARRRLFGYPGDAGTGSADPRVRRARPSRICPVRTLGYAGMVATLMTKTTICSR